MEFVTWSTRLVVWTHLDPRREGGYGEPVVSARTAGQPQGLQVHGYAKALSPFSLADPRSSRFLGLIMILNVTKHQFRKEGMALRLQLWWPKSIPVTVVLSGFCGHHTPLMGAKQDLGHSSWKPGTVWLVGPHCSQPMGGLLSSTSATTSWAVGTISACPFTLWARLCPAASRVDGRVWTTHQSPVISL